MLMPSDDVPHWLARALHHEDKEWLARTLSAAEEALDAVADIDPQRLSDDHIRSSKMANALDRFVRLIRRASAPMRAAMPNLPWDDLERVTEGLFVYDEAIDREFWDMAGVCRTIRRWVPGVAAMLREVSEREPPG